MAIGKHEHVTGALCCACRRFDGLAQDNAESGGVFGRPTMQGEELDCLLTSEVAVQNSRIDSGQVDHHQRVQSVT
jgi:hypothetical protein